MLFTVEFKSDGKGGFISAEKSLQASLFGSDTIAGVPLALAGFIVPGLFFWVITSLFRIPWSVGIALGDKMIYSVLVSIGFVLIGTWIESIDIDVRKGIGVIKLLYLAGGGAALGILVGFITRIYMSIRRRHRAERQINFSEEPESIFRKLLLKNPNITQGQFSITLDNEKGEEYIGSLFEQTPNTTSETGFTSIVGWCKIFNEIKPQARPASWLQRVLKKLGLINQKTPQAKWQQMQELFNNNKLVELYDLAKREGFTMEWEGVSARQQDGRLIDTEEKAMQWRNDELRGAPQPQENSNKPVRLVGN
jgi:hypothetical protein